MTFAFDFSDLMLSTITVAPMASVDRYAQEVYSTSTTDYPCYIEYKYQNVIDFMGREVVSNTEVILASTSTIEATAQFTLPDNSTPNLVSMTQIEDTEQSVFYHFLYFGGAGG